MRRDTLIKSMISGVLCGASGVLGRAQPAFAQEQTMRIGSVIDPLVSTPFLVAQETGLFAKHNVPASVKLFSSGALIAPAITGKSLDMGATGGVPATFLAGHQVDIKVIARICEVSWAYEIMAMPSAKITKPSDITGKTVSMTYGTVSQYLILAFAQHWGIPLNSFKMVNLNGSDQVNALVTGKVDVASLWKPFTSKARESGAVTLETALKSDFPGRTGNVKLVGDPGVLFATSDFLSKNEAATVGLLQALYEALQWAPKHEKETAQIVSRALNITPEDVIQDLKPAEFSMQFDPDLINELHNEWDFLSKQGFITGEFKQAFIDAKYMRRAVPSMVSVR